MFTQTISPVTQKQIERIVRLVARRDDAWAIPCISAEFLHSLVLAGGYRRGLEVGMSYGYSGLWIAAALQHNGGTLTTLEHNAAKVAAGRETFAQAALADTVIIVAGDAAETLADLSGPFDFVFLDADKENTRRYFDLIWPKLAHRATIVTDNVTSHANELKDFVKHLRNHPHLVSTLLPIGSGLEITVKLDPYRPTVTPDGADWVI